MLVNPVGAVESAGSPLPDGDLRVVYCDLDGTLVGPGGSLFSHPDGPTSAAANAIRLLTDARVELVLLSGRSRQQLREAARTVGAGGYLAEMGGVTARRDAREEIVTRNWGSFSGAGTPYEAIQRSGAAGVLLEAFPDLLEPHAPAGSTDRECSMLFRGAVDLASARRLLAETGYRWLDLWDNGVIWSPAGRFPDLHVEHVHIYHLTPAGVSKRSGLALDRSQRGLRPEQVIAIGDSLADVDAAPEVAAFFLVANGLPALGSSRLPPNARVTEASYGLGFAEAVLPLVAR